MPFVSSNQEFQSTAWMIRVGTHPLLLLLFAFQIARANDKHFHSYLENAATMGRPLLVEDVDEPFDRTIARIAGQVVHTKRGEWRMTIGDQKVQVADGFRLYLTTRLDRPLLMPETLACVDVVDFALTEEAITDQLLDCVFRHDKPVS